MWWVILSLRKLFQTAMHWQNRLFLTLESLIFHLIFLTVNYYVFYKQKSMQWHHWSVHIALRGINKKGVTTMFVSLSKQLKFAVFIEWKISNLQLQDDDQCMYITVAFGDYLCLNNQYVYLLLPSLFCL